MQKLGDKLKFGSGIEFAQRLDKFLKIKTRLRFFMQI